MRFLILRAAYQSPFLISQITQCGAQVELLPTIEIQPYKDKTSLPDSVDKILVTSVNAAQHGQHYLQDVFTKNPYCKIGAIGPSTQAALSYLDYNVNIIPEGRYNSEGLLQHAELQQVADQSIVILSGIGGRELLQQGLLARGANVCKIASYQRVLPDIDVAPILEKIRSSQISQVICHSGEALQNLITLLAEEASQKIFSLPLLVVSERIKTIAEDLNWQAPIIVADGATDRAVWERLRVFIEETAHE